MIRDTFPNVSSTANAYGLTETSSVATVIGGPGRHRQAHLGRPARADGVA